MRTASPTRRVRSSTSGRTAGAGAECTAATGTEPLQSTRDEWAAFLDGAKAGEFEFDRL
ncbi:hypothetical protein [Pseudonocardia sp.]|uniref:hypothetical protein n=1 Tax=Pseudonocardia sp. TaxID=60912 RepID=UPI003D0D76E7